MNKFITSLSALAIANVLICAPLTANGQNSAVTSAPDNPWSGSNKERSPFTAVRWNNSTPEVRVGDNWFELLAIDDLPADKIVDTCKLADPKGWQKRFEEDLVAVLNRLNHAPGDIVTLKLKNVQTDSEQTLEHVAMAKENRRKIIEARPKQAETVKSTEPTAPSNAAPATSENTSHRWTGDFPKLSPFEAVRWSHDETATVRVGGVWYELLAFNDVPVGEIIAACKSLDEDDWRRRFDEDLVEVLARSGHEPGANVTLKVRYPETTQIQILQNVALTTANREALRTALRDPLTRQQAEEDLDELQNDLESRYSYLNRTGFDYRSTLTDLRHRLKPVNNQNDLKLAIEKIIARFGDGHSGVGDLDGALPKGFAPFLLGDTDQGLVTFQADRSNFLAADFPFLKSLDGVPVEKWLDAAKPMVPAGSPQFVRRGCIRLLRYVNFLRRELGLPTTPTVRVELQAGSNGPTKILDLPIAPEKPIYGSWPHSADRLLPENIGYLRLESMEDDKEFLDRIAEKMRQFRNTRGLIIDVRENGGGLRAGLRELFPYFMRPDDAPRVFNVAAYRLGPDDKPNQPEGYLADRGLYPSTSKVWTDAERAMLNQFAKTFKPQWIPPAGKFSDWHYAVISPVKNEQVYYYDRPVLVLLDAGCFSATDIFLGTFKGWRNVTLLGSASGGDSGRPREFTLPNGLIHVRLSSIVSFQSNGQLYDGNGIKPDVEVKPQPTDFLGRSDAVLDAAIRRLTGNATTK